MSVESPGALSCVSQIPLSSARNPKSLTMTNLIKLIVGAEISGLSIGIETKYEHGSSRFGDSIRDMHS